MAATLVCCCFISCDKSEELDNVETTQITVSLVSPSDSSVGVSLTPTFEWSADITPADLAGVTYDLYLGLSESDMSLIEEGSTAQSFTTSDELEMAQTYYWKVIAQSDDQEFSSLPYSFTVRSLEVPVSTFPADEAEVDALSSFKWNQIEGQDGVSYTYTVWAIEDDNADAVQFMVGSVEDEGEYTLTDNDYALFSYGFTYKWWVVVSAGDNTATGDALTFTNLDTKTSTLTAPTAIAPDGAETTEAITFEWDQSEGAESLTYTIWAIEDDNAKAEAFIIGSVDDAGQYSMDASDYADLALDATYKWWVVVTSETETAKSNTLTFNNTSADAPSRPVTLTPASSTSMTSCKNIEFTWQAAVDPNGEAVSYELSYTANGGETKTLGSNITATSYTGTVESATSTLTEYSWWVKATNSSGDTATSAKSNFYIKTSVDIDEVSSGVLGLGEAITWDPIEGATYSIYIKESSSSTYELVASGVESPSYKIPNSKMPCSLVSGAKTFNVYVDANIGASTITSDPISFKPAMTGSITDTRGAETNTYTWVRIGSSVWLSQNLKTAYFNDGTPIPFKDSGALIEDNTSDASTSDEAYYDTTLYGYDTAHQYFWENDTKHANDAANIFTTWDEETYIEKTGYVYSYWTAVNEKLAPEGWHLSTHAEWENLLSDSDLMALSTSQLNGLGNATDLSAAKMIVHTDYTGATNTLGLGLTMTATRASSSYEWGDVISPYRPQLWQYSGTYWMEHEECLAYFLDGTYAWSVYAMNDIYRLCYRLTIGHSGSGTWNVCRNTWAMGYFFGVRCIMDDDQN